MKKKQKSSLLVKYLDLYNEKPHSRVFAPLAESYRKLGMFDEAFKVLRDGIKRHPSYVLGYLVLAHCYFDQRKFEEAYTTLRPFVSDHVDNISLQKLYAEICIKVGSLDEALQTYKYLLFLNPKDSEVSRKVKALEDDLQVAEVKEESAQQDKSYLEFDEDNWVQVDFQKKQAIPSSQIEERSRATDEFEPDEWQLEKSKVSEVFSKLPQEVKGVAEPSETEEVYDVEADDELAEELLAPKKDIPLITHTLIDLYMAQEHYGKAIEVLEKILELNPDDERSRAKLDEVTRIMNGEEPVQEDGGHEKLLDLVEQKVKGKNFQLHLLSEKFQLFLEGLRHRASSV
jgi:tetratricopeptide (TPR) repeat protein